jgi:hypothetical protein
MDQYNGRNRFGYWPNMTCDSVKLATEGVQYHQQISKDDNLHFFRKTLCRVTPIVYESTWVLYDTCSIFYLENIVCHFPRHSAACVNGRMSRTRQYNKHIYRKWQTEFFRLNTEPVVCKLKITLCVLFTS